MEPEDRRAWKSALDVASVGIEMAVAVVVGWYAGDWLDNRFGTAPYLTVFLTLAGVGAAFKGLWRTARKNWPRDDGPPGAG